MIGEKSGSHDSQPADARRSSKSLGVVRVVIVTLFSVFLLCSVLSIEPLAGNCFDLIGSSYKRKALRILSQNPLIGMRSLR
jgi:hypothetical protein